MSRANRYQRDNYWDASEYLVSAYLFQVGIRLARQDYWETRFPNRNQWANFKVYRHWQKVPENNKNQNIDFSIVRYVPFRLIRPFFKQELQGLKDVINQRIEVLSREHFETRKPFILLLTKMWSHHYIPEWASYIKTNYPIVRAWVSWEWLQYMQRCNPNVLLLPTNSFPKTENL